MKKKSKDFEIVAKNIKEKLNEDMVRRLRSLIKTCECKHKSRLHKFKSYRLYTRICCCILGTSLLLLLLTAFAAGNIFYGYCRSSGFGACYRMLGIEEEYPIAY